MILILSDEDDPTTDWVIEWLHWCGKPFSRFSIEWIQRRNCFATI